MRTFNTILAAGLITPFCDPVSAETPDDGSVLPFPPTPSASETFDVGVDLGSPVSTVYLDRRPFEFEGTINSVKVELTR